MQRLVLAVLVLAAVAAHAQPPKLPVPAGEVSGWASVARYASENAALPAANAKRVVFIGDSITEAWGHQPFIADDHDHIGRGISGQTTPQVMTRFPTDAIALKPRVVHIMAGTNDVAGNTGPETDAEIQSYIAEMVRLAQANGIAVILASIPPAADFPWRPTAGAVARIRGLNAWIKAYAAEHDAVYADYWPVLATEAGAMKPQYSVDGVHPNAAGFSAMAPIARAAIAKAMRAR